MRTLWVITHTSDGWSAAEHYMREDGTIGDATDAAFLGPFPNKPDLETELLKAGVGFMDRKEI